MGGGTVGRSGREAGDGKGSWSFVRQDVAANESLRNAPPREVKHNYGEELAMPVNLVRQAVAGFPATLAGLPQSVFLMPLQHDVARGDSSAGQPRWVWAEGWGDDVLADEEAEARAARWTS